MKPKRILLIVIVLFVLSVIAASCSPQKRINRITAKHPHLVQKDTVWITDTVIIDNYKFDTTTILVQHKTVEVVNNEKVKLIYRFDTITNQIWHEVTCYGDTLIKEIHIPVDKYIVKNEIGKSIRNYLISAILLFVIFIIIKYFLKK